MKHRSDEERIRLYRESIARAWSHGDSNSWPIKLNAAFHLFLKDFGEELLADISHLETSGYSLRRIAKLFYNPARIYRLIDSTVYSMRRNRYPLAEQRRVVLKLLAMVKSLKSGSEFSEDGCNIIYDQQVASEMMTAKPFAPVRGKQESQLIHRFCGVMWAYTESIFFRAHDVTKEIHGPYLINDGRQKLIVKEYLNLRPTAIWPRITLLPCDTIKLYKVYDDSLSLRIDALNHVYYEGGSLIPGLKHYRVEVDGHEMKSETLSQFLPVIQRTIVDISDHIEAINWNERVMKYAEIFWFRKKPLREARGLDWRVPQSVRRNIMAGMENPARRQQLSDKESQALALLTV